MATPTMSLSTHPGATMAEISTTPLTGAGDLTTALGTTTLTDTTGLVTTTEI